MSKKILLFSAIILILTVVFAACKGKSKVPDKIENTDKVVQTVPITGKDGGTTNVEIFEDSSGDRYITNVDGDKIPLTTDKDGFNDDIGYLVTSKPAPTKPDTGNNSSNPVNPTDPTGSQPSSANNSTEPEGSTGSGITIDKTGKQDSISWEEILHPKKKS